MTNSSITPKESWFLGFFLSDWGDCAPDLADRFVGCARVVAKRVGVASPKDRFLGQKFVDSVIDFYDLSEPGKSIPIAVRESSLVARLHFLSGVLSGGGYLSLISGNIGLKDHNESFVSQVAELAQGFEIFCDVEHLCGDPIAGCETFFEFSAGDIERLEELFVEHDVFVPWC